MVPIQLVLSAHLSYFSDVSFDLIHRLGVVWWSSSELVLFEARSRALESFSIIENLMLSLPLLKSDGINRRLRVVNAVNLLPEARLPREEDIMIRGALSLSLRHFLFLLEYIKSLLLHWLLLLVQLSHQ